jgi:hypothetical protein
MSVGYANAAGTVEDQEFEIIEGAAPAGSISASAGAMAKFMIAYLNYGRLGEVRVLEQETARRMLERAFTHDERLNGMALGFYEKSSHGLRILGHGGDTGWFHTDLAIVPSEDLGVFVSYNTAAGGQLSFGRFLKAFLDHYYPVTDPPAAVRVERAELERLAGVYRFNRGSYTTFEKALRLATPVTVGVTEDDRLLVSSPLGPQRFYHVGGGLYREVDGPMELAFREDESGRVTHAFLSLVPIMALERVGTLSSPALHLTLLAIAIGVMVVTLVSLPVAWYVRRRYGVSPGGPGERRARLVALLVAIVDVAFVIGAFALLAVGSGLLLRGETTWITVVLAVGVVAAILTIALLISTVLVWRRGYWSVWGRLRYSVAAAAAVVFLLVLNTWNLLGFKLG